MKVYYFGCYGDTGHYLWVSPGHKDLKIYRLQPWSDSLDGSLCPGGEDHFRAAQTEGHACLHHKDGWTAVAFWDRTVDTRRNSNSAFIAEGTFTFDEIVIAAKAQWPEVWERFTFEVVEADK